MIKKEMGVSAALPMGDAAGMRTVVGVMGAAGPPAVQDAGARGGDEPIRLTHHTERVVFPGDGKKAKAYFKALEESYSRCWCVNRVHGAYRSELDFYQERYGAAVEVRNQAHIKNRHPGRMFSTKDLHGKKHTCPEELTIQASGKNRVKSLDPEVFKDCVMQYLSWMQGWGMAHGDCLHILGAYISKEMPYKAVIRRVWDCPGKGGLREVNMVGALKMAGVPCPDQEEEKDSRFNNRKMTFDRMSREELYKCFEVKGVAVNREPGVYTLRKALKLKEAADMEEQYAKDMLREIMEVEAQMPPVADGLDIPGVLEGPDGGVMVPEGAYRMLKIRECLAGAYAAKGQAAGKRLLDALDKEQEVQKTYVVQNGIQEAMELEYAALRIGLLRCGYYIGNRNID